MAAATAYTNTRVYTDFQALQQVKYDKNSASAKKEVALQFEAILMQMVLHSMRDANKTFAADSMFGSDQMDLYQDMFDKQLSLVMSQNGTGLAAMIEKNMDQLSGTATPATPAALPPQLALLQTEITRSPTIQAAAAIAPTLAPLAKSVADPKSTNSPEPSHAFLKKIWSAAKKAASELGAAPEVLLAQVVLETNWGKSVITHPNQESSYNLFNIKAGQSWTKKTFSVSSLEERHHVLVKEKSDFRGYNSYDESFTDYVDLLRNNPRYRPALEAANSPSGFAEALQHAGFATDSHYAKKIMGVFSSDKFQQIMRYLQQSS